jgi:hypothetical protein
MKWQFWQDAIVKELFSQILDLEKKEKDGA